MTHKHNYILLPSRYHFLVWRCGGRSWGSCNRPYYYIPKAKFYARMFDNRRTSPKDVIQKSRFALSDYSGAPLRLVDIQGEPIDLIFDDFNPTMVVKERTTPKGLVRKLLGLRSPSRETLEDMLRPNDQ